MKIVESQTEKKITQTFDNNWAYEYTVTSRTYNRPSQRKYYHYLIDPSGNKLSFVPPDITSQVAPNIILLMIYHQIGEVYSTKNWKYFIKLHKDFRLTHYLEINNSIKEIPHFNTKLVDKKMLLEWEKFHFMPPNYTGNKTICEDMFKKLRTVLKEYGKINENCTYILDEHMKEIELLLVIKKLTK